MEKRLTYEMNLDTIEQFLIDQLKSLTKRSKVIKELIAKHGPKKYTYKAHNIITKVDGHFTSEYHSQGVDMEGETNYHSPREAVVKSLLEELLKNFKIHMDPHHYAAVCKILARESYIAIYNSTDADGNVIQVDEASPVIRAAEKVADKLILPPILKYMEQKRLEREKTIFDEA